jgi:hypothetical protein
VKCCKNRHENQRRKKKKPIVVIPLKIKPQALPGKVALIVANQKTPKKSLVGWLTR